MNAALNKHKKTNINFNKYKYFTMVENECSTKNSSKQKLYSNIVKSECSTKYTSSENKGTQ